MADPAEELLHAIVPDAPLPAYLSLPTRDLLRKFGSGGHKPGSGSVAALNGMISCELISTVTSLTEGKKAYRAHHAEMRELRRKSDTHRQKLEDLFHKDAEAFDRVILARRRRDTSQIVVERRQYREAALRALELATDIPIATARECISVAELGLVAFDLGFRAARGDSGMAVNSALAGARGAMMIAFLNLTLFKGSRWAIQTMATCEEVKAAIRPLEDRLASRVTNLQDEGTAPMQLPLFDPENS